MNVELEALRKIERIARALEGDALSLTSHLRCQNCGTKISQERGVANEVRSRFDRTFRELELALVQVDLVRAGSRT